MRILHGTCDRNVGNHPSELNKSSFDAMCRFAFHLTFNHPETLNPQPETQHPITAGKGRTHQLSYDANQELLVETKVPKSPHSIKATLQLLGQDPEP